MPYKRPNSPYYWISWTDASGHKVRRSSGSADKAEATAMEQRLRADSHDARKKVQGVSAAFDIILIEYLEQPGRLTAPRRTAARQLQEAFAGQSVLDIKPHDIRAYIEERQEEVADPTINKELVLFSAAINEYNRRFGAMIPNPVSGLKLRESSGRTRWITKEEAKKLLLAASPHVADYITIGLYTGMRRKEMTTLNWRDIDLARGIITVRCSKTKRGEEKYRAIPIHGNVKLALDNCKARWPESVLVFDGIQDFKTGFRGACERAGIEKFTPHDMRHTFASWLVISGVNLYEVKDLLGHSTIKLTERYAHLAPENLKAAVNRL